MSALLRGIDDGDRGQRARAMPVMPSGAPVASLLQIFPFAFLVDGSGRLRALGHFFATRHQDLLDRAFADVFTAPGLPADGDLWRAIVARSDQGACGARLDLVFNARPLAHQRTPSSAEAARPPLPLSGTLVPIDGDGKGDVLFLGTIAPGHVTNIASHGLSIGDFGPADPTPDFAMMAEVNAGILADFQLMNQQLKIAHDQAVSAQRELERHRDHLEDLVRDRTALVESQAVELKEALAQEKYLAELQRGFVSMASHEFRTPLAIIDGNAQRIERRLVKLTPDNLLERIKKIRFAVRRMTSLMESTLAAARMEAGKIEVTPEPVDVRGILLDCCEVQEELSRRHRIVVDHDGLPEDMIADPASLTQIMTNLLSNAVKYSPEADQILVRGWQEGAEVLISVRDYGLGIDEEEQNRIFTRFFRAKTSVGIPGTGIGLNLALLLAEEHGGTITLASEKGKGSTFTLRLPRAAEVDRAVA